MASIHSSVLPTRVVPSGRWSSSGQLLFSLQTPLSGQTGATAQEFEPSISLSSALTVSSSSAMEKLIYIYRKALDK